MKWLLDTVDDEICIVAKCPTLHLTILGGVNIGDQIMLQTIAFLYQD